MKPTSVLLALLLLAGAVGGVVAWRRATEPARAWAEFLELEGIDVRALTGARRERAGALFHRFHGGNEPGATRFEPWALLRGASGAGSPECWVAVGCREVSLGFHESMFELHLATLGPGGRKKHDYRVGFVGKPAAARAGRRTEIEGHALELSVEGGDGLVKYILACEGLPELVRVEDGAGRIRPMPSIWVNEGPLQLDALEPALWRDALASPRPALVLAALARLGERCQGGRPPTVVVLLGRREVVDRLEALRVSPNPWIREAAEVALRP